MGQVEAQATFRGTKESSFAFLLHFNTILDTSTVAKGAQMKSLPSMSPINSYRRTCHITLDGNL